MVKRCDPVKQLEKMDRLRNVLRSKTLAADKEKINRKGRWQLRVKTRRRYGRIT